MPTVVLHPGRDRSVRRRHPWVLSGAVARVEGAGTGEGAASAPPGSEPASSWARVVSAEGETLGYGFLSPASQIRVRLLTFGKDAPDDGLVAERIREAVARRAGDPLVGDTDAVRLVNAEGDGLPGLVVDRYANAVVVRIGTAGMAARRAGIAETLREVAGAEHGYERADAAAARREGMAAHDGPLWGDAPPARVPILERERRYLVDVAHGQKTGFYLDQRDARDLVQALARGRRVLDLYSYTGGFAVAAACGGAASLTLVDSSADALALARENLDVNPHVADLRVVERDVHQFVRSDDRLFDLLVIDPPPLAKRAADVERAARAHKDVLLYAFRRGAPGAYALAFSCSQAVDAKLLRQIVFGASLDAGRPARVLRELGAPADHPVSLDHPEGTYLHGLLLQL